VSAKCAQRLTEDFEEVHGAPENRSQVAGGRCQVAGPRSQVPGFRSQMSCTLALFLQPASKLADLAV
jgi:hypothetical protein